MEAGGEDKQNFCETEWTCHVSHMWQKNWELQGKGKTFCDTISAVKTFKAKLGLFLWQKKENVAASEVLHIKRYMDLWTRRMDLPKTRMDLQRASKRTVSLTVAILFCEEAHEILTTKTRRKYVALPQYDS